MSAALLAGRAVLAIEGEDVRGFLQGLVSNDMRRVAPGALVFSALLSPQGKFLFEFFVAEHEGALLLDTQKARLPELVKRLTMYRLRAKVTFAERNDLSVAAFWDNAPAAPGALLACPDPRHPALGLRAFYTSAPPGLTDDYDAHRIALAIPEGGVDLIPDRALLLEYGYDHLHAVDFAKGCYVGQEVTARSKHRATLHKYIHAVSAESPLPAPGTKVTANGRELGELRSAAGPQGLALLRWQDVAAAQQAGAELSAEGVAIKAQLPSWFPAH